MDKKNLRPTVNRCQLIKVDFFLEVLNCLPTQIYNSFFLILHTYVIFARKYTIYDEFQNIETMSTNLPSLHSEDHELDDVHISWTCQNYILATILFFSADMDAINLHKYCLVNIGEVRTVLRLWVRFPFVSNTDHGNKHSPVTRRHKRHCSTASSMNNVTLSPSVCFIPILVWYGRILSRQLMTMSLYS